MQSACGFLNPHVIYLLSGQDLARSKIWLDLIIKGFSQCNKSRLLLFELRINSKCASLYAEQKLKPSIWSLAAHMCREGW
jgi:hypothetical protein